MSIKELENINTEDFISQIEQHAAIWNDKSEEYSNKIEKKNAWENVIVYFIADFNDKQPKDRNEIGAYFQKKWKSLRNSYTRELAKKKKEKSGSAASGRKQYVYFEQLRFLETCCKETTDSLENEDDTAAAENEIKDVRPKLTQSSKRKQKNREDDELINILKQKLRADTISDNRVLNEDDEDKLFLLSLLPELKKVPENMRLRTKMQILEVILKTQDSIYGIPGQPPPSLPSYSGHTLSFPNYSSNLQPQHAYYSSNKTMSPYVTLRQPTLEKEVMVDSARYTDLSQSMPSTSDTRAHPNNIQSPVYSSHSPYSDDSQIMFE